MKFAASLTVTGLLGFVILEALKILLAPLAGWLLGVGMIALKAAILLGVVLGAFLALGVGVYAYRRMRRDPYET